MGSFLKRRLTYYTFNDQLPEGRLTLTSLMTITKYMPAVYIQSPGVDLRCASAVWKRIETPESTEADDVVKSSSNSPMLLGRQQVPRHVRG